MKRIALDTNAYVAFKRGEPQALEIVRRANKIGMPAVVLGELLGGFEAGTRNVQNRRELSDFLDAPRVAVLPVTLATADHYARIFRRLKLNGTPIPTNDMWIAATALEQAWSLYTYDSHFSVIDGLATAETWDGFSP